MHSPGSCLEQEPVTRLTSNDFSRKIANRSMGTGRNKIVFCSLASSRTDQTGSQGLKDQLAHRINGVDVFIPAFRLGLRK
jgi:hypothetical protein